jgi:hypothetical protein
MASLAKRGAYRGQFGIDRGAPTRLAATRASKSSFVNRTQRSTLTAAGWRLAHSSRTFRGVVLR